MTIDNPILFFQEPFSINTKYKNNKIVIKIVATSVGIIAYQWIKNDGNFIK